MWSGKITVYLQFRSMRTPGLLPGGGTAGRVLRAPLKRPPPEFILPTWPAAGGVVCSYVCPTACRSTGVPGGVPGGVSSGGVAVGMAVGVGMAGSVGVSVDNSVGAVASSPVRSVEPLRNSLSIVDPYVNGRLIRRDGQLERVGVRSEERTRRAAGGGWRVAGGG